MSFDRRRFNRWVFLLIFAIVSSSACADQPDKTFDAAKLIGTTIPARLASNTGLLSDWNEKGGWSLGDSKLGLGLSEYYRGNQSILIITRRDKHLNRTILDAMKLPMHLLDYKIVGNYKNPNKDIEFLPNRYSLAECESKAISAPIIIGLAKPEKKFTDCAHRTKRIYAAWAIDTKTGKLKSISPKGVTCLLADFEDSCEHMQTIERD